MKKIYLLVFFLSFFSCKDLDQYKELKKSSILKGARTALIEDETLDGVVSLTNLDASEIETGIARESSSIDWDYSVLEDNPPQEGTWLSPVEVRAMRLPDFEKGPGRGGPSMFPWLAYRAKQEEIREKYRKIVKPGKIHDRRSQCDVFKNMWAASFQSGQPYRENAALITPNGILWLPNDNNTRSSARLDYYKYVKNPNGGYSVVFGNQQIPILGLIHTHPNGWQRGLSISNNPNVNDDFKVVEFLNVPNFVINTYGEIWKGVFDNEGNKRSFMIIDGNNYNGCSFNIYNHLSKRP